MKLVKVLWVPKEKTTKGKVHKKTKKKKLTNVGIALTPTYVQLKLTFFLFFSICPGKTVEKKKKEKK